jgi:L-ascorbate metabolism protein UlaG (beta-lactamase superfamily)
MSVSAEPVFLRSNAIIEPLVDRFYAWMHTVSPAAASLNLARVQIPLLESRLRNPQAHVAAGTGSPSPGHFVEESRGLEVAALLDSIKKDRADMLAFADAIAEAGALLRQHVTGSDLTRLHQELPAALNGLVELACDTGNRASLRLLESLLYASPYYDVSRQSIRLSLDTGVERPSILDSPRLPDPDMLDLKIPFTHPGIDELFAARIAPTTLGHLREALEVDDARTEQLRRLLTDKPNLSPDRHIEKGGRIRYFGHACLVIQSAETTIVTDPLISADNRHGDRYTLDDLPDRIDLALITHGRQDHLVLETLLQLRTRIGAIVVPRSSRGNLCDPSIGLFLKELGFTVIEVDDFDAVPIPGGRVVATPFLGGHSDLDIRAKSTFFVRIAGATVYIGADTSGVDPVVYRHVRDRLGHVDMAFLGMERDGAPLARRYQGLSTRPATTISDSREPSRSDAARAAAIMTELGADEGYLYAMGEESWLGHVVATAHAEDPDQFKQIEEFLGWCSGNGITAGRLFNKREWRW